MNLEKRIKRHIIGRRQAFLAVTLPGVETLCRSELTALSDTVQVTDTFRGGVAFSGRLEDLYRANLHLRAAGRILMRVAAFKVTNFNQLAKHLTDIQWALYLPQGAVPACKVTARHSRLYHSRAVADQAASAIGDYWTSLGVPSHQADDQTLYLRLDQDLLVLSLDSSGANLYQRGLKTHSTRAPLRETTAAAILRMAGYHPDRPLLDPMCGAGTFSLEAALMAKAQAPGLHRSFAFMQWPAFRPPQWHFLKGRAVQQIRELQHPSIQASDIDARGCEVLAACVQRNGLQDAVKVTCRDFFNLSSEACVGGPGLIVLNPPYGRRLNPDQAPARFYNLIGKKLKQTFTGWQVALIVPHLRLAETIPLKLEHLNLQHGGLRLTLLTGTIR